MSVPSYVLRRLVSLEEAHGTFSEAGASAMLALDAEAGRTRSVRDYARLWNWSKSRVQRALDELRDDLGLCESKMADLGQQRDSSGTENADCEPEREISGTRAGQQRDTSPPPLDGPPPSSPTPPPTTPPLSPPPAPSLSRAREESNPGDDRPDDRSDQQPDATNDFDPVEAFHRTYAELPEQHPWHGYRLGILQQPRVTGTVTDADAWAECLRKWTEAEYSPRGLDNLLDAYRAERESAAQPDAGDDRGAGGQVPAEVRRPAGPNGGAARGARRGASGLRGTPQHRKSASDRRSEYGYDDASRDVDAALADLIAADEARRGGADAGGRDDG